MTGNTIYYKNGVYIKDTAVMVGPKEGEGPLKKYFDKIIDDDLLGQKSHEFAEVMLHTYTLRYLLNKTKYEAKDIDICLSGDLLDEIVGSSFTLRNFEIPFIGVYNACATFGAALSVGAMMLDSGKFEKCICSTSSHFSSAERQYRFPLELGAQRTPLSQWTVTGAGAVLLTSEKQDVRLESSTLGRVVDFGVKDPNDMGAAMAPSAADTLVRHFRDTRREPSYYDFIATGDLGDGGSRLLKILMEKEGYPLDDNYFDCGNLIFNREAQKVGQGGSGTGCSSSVFGSYIYKNMLSGKFKKVLLVPTGALISKLSSLQGETIPGISHAVSFCKDN